MKYLEKDNNREEYREARNDNERVHEVLFRPIHLE